MADIYSTRCLSSMLNLSCFVISLFHLAHLEVNFDPLRLGSYFYKFGHLLSCSHEDSEHSSVTTASQLIRQVWTNSQVSRTYWSVKTKENNKLLPKLSVVNIQTEVLVKIWPIALVNEWLLHISMCSLLVLLPNEIAWLIWLNHRLTTFVIF